MMSLFEKGPVQNPCEAETFEEAARNNRSRLFHERDLSKDLHEQMKRDQEPGAEAYDPVFWEGAIAANELASLYYWEELKALRIRVAERLAANPIPALGEKAYESGWNSIRESWIKALQKDDPSIIVYW